MAVACEGQLDAIVGEANLSDSAADISERHGVYERLANLGVPLPKHVQEPSTEQHVSRSTWRTTVLDVAQCMSSQDCIFSKGCVTFVLSPQVIAHLSDSTA